MKQMSAAYRRVHRDNIERSHEMLLSLRDTLWNACQQAVRVEYGSDDPDMANAGRAAFFSLVDGPVIEVEAQLSDNASYHGLDYPKKSFEHDEFVRLERLKELCA